MFEINTKLLFLIKGVSTIPDECMEVGLEIGTSGVIGNEAPENRSGRLRRIFVDDIVSANGDIREKRVELQMVGILMVLAS